MCLKCLSHPALSVMLGLPADDACEGGGARCVTAWDGQPQPTNV